MNTKNVDEPRESRSCAASTCAHSSNPAIEQSPLSTKRYKSLDHWRGIACLLIVINHATLPLCGDPTQSAETHATRAAADKTDDPSPSVGTLQPLAKLSKFLVLLTTKMHFGVQIFFVISGYCVTASAQSLQRSGRKISEYFRRRFMRIYPPFWCALACSVIACFAIDRMNPGLLKMTPWPLPVPWDLSPAQWIGCLTLTGTWLGYFTGPLPELCFPIQSWSLCYEEQFYVVVGVLLAFSGRHFFRVAAVTTAAIFAVDATALYSQVPIRGFFFDEHWFMFAAGVGVYWCLHRATPRQSILSQTALITSMVGLLALARSTTLFGNGPQFLAFKVVAALGFAQLLIWLKRHDERIDNVKWLNWLKSCGVMCYSIYLVHLFPGKLISQYLLMAGYQSDASILLICVPLALATSISLGYLFHVTVERHFLVSHREDKVQPRSSGTRPEVVPNPEQASWILSFQECKAAMDRLDAKDPNSGSQPGKAA